MKTSTALFVSVHLLVGGLIITDNLTSWDMWWKIAVAVGLGVIPFFFVKHSTPSPSTPTSSTPAPKSTPANRREAFGGQLIEVGIGMGILAFVIYAIVVWLLIPFVKWTTTQPGDDEPQTRVVSNGFMSHDTVYPREKSTYPFDKVLQAGKTYDVFPVKAGDAFRIYRMNRPVKVKIAAPGVTGYDEITGPGRHRAQHDGILQVISTTSGNHVYFHNEN